MTPPALSIAIASASSGGALDRCLAALMPQAAGRPVEVVVAHAGPAPAVPGGVRVLSLPRDTPLPDLWGAAIAATTSPIVAVLDTTSVVGAGWVDAALEAVTEARPIAGGAVEPPMQGGATAWTAYFCEYAQFMRPLPAGPARELPGNNVVFQRRLLDIGREYTSPAFWKTYWCGELAAAGVPLAAEPSLEIVDAKNHRFAPFLLRRFRHGRCYGGMRRLTPARRAVYAAGSVVLPLLMITRQTRAVWPRQRHRGRFSAVLPLMLLADIAWATGEAVGYAAGAGRACRQVV